MREASRELRKCERGAAYVEFIVAFVPVFTFFAGIMQYALMSTAQVFVDHAATVAARTAALSLGRPGADENAGQHDTPVRLGTEREGLVRKAVVLTLAPLILDGTAIQVNVDYPKTADPVAPDDPTQTFAAMTYTTTPYIRTRVQMKMACLIPVANRLMCGIGLAGGIVDPTKWLEAESVFPVERATYQPKQGCEPPLTGEAVASNGPANGLNPPGLPAPPAFTGNPGLPLPQCFVAGTLVATPDGLRPIEQIAPGDRVDSRNPETGVDSVEVVLRTFENHSTHRVHLRVQAEGSDGVVAIDATRSHPFWRSPQGWTSAVDLAPGDLLLDERGAMVHVVTTEPLEGDQLVYNLEVQNTRTYFVSEDSVWVHNTNQQAANNLALANAINAACFPPRANATVVVATVEGPPPAHQPQTVITWNTNSGFVGPRGWSPAKQRLQDCVEQAAAANGVPNAIVAFPQGNTGNHAEQNLASWLGQHPGYSIQDPNTGFLGSVGVNRPFCNHMASGANCESVSLGFPYWATPVNRAPPGYYESQDGIQSSNGAPVPPPGNPGWWRNHPSNTDYSPQPDGPSGSRGISGSCG